MLNFITLKSLDTECLNMLRQMLHYSLHFIFPAIIAVIISKEAWIKIYIIFLATMLIDLDHIFSTPIFESLRCSIGFHPLHAWIALIIYFLLLLYPKSRIIGIALLLHLLTDYIDCLLIDMVM